jgi:hypothetical protein
MVSEEHVKMIGAVITAELAMIIGQLIYKSANGWIDLPSFFDNRYVRKVAFFVVFIIAAALIMWAGPWITDQLWSTTIGSTNLLIASGLIAVAIYLIYDYFNV